jgi:DNA-binding NarL/FixJ family response regulator
MNAVRVAVVDPLPMFAHGVAAALADQGQQVETPADIVDWARAAGRPVILLTLLAPDDWALLARLLTLRPDAAVLTFVEQPDVASFVRALAAGALGVLARDAPPAAVRETFQAAVQDRVILPAGVARAMALPSRSMAANGSPAPTEREIGWLRRLGRGSTVAQLAADVGYSERMMFRLLADLYSKVGAANRTEAMMSARERGWI